MTYKKHLKLLTIPKLKVKRCTVEIQFVDMRLDYDNLISSPSRKIISH